MRPDHPRIAILALFLLITGEIRCLAADSSIDSSVPESSSGTVTSAIPTTDGSTTPTTQAAPVSTTATPTGSAPNATTSPAATGTSSDNAVPDFLKEYSTPSSLQQATTPITTTPVTATPVTSPPSLRPNPAPKPVVTPVRPNVTEAPKAPAATPTMLKGRLEEIAGPGAKLPVGFLLNLKAQKGKVDPTAVKPKNDKIQGLLASFPVDWQGNWGGQIKIHFTQQDKAAWDFDPEEAKETLDILKPGTVGTTTFSFYQDARNILLQPARVTFPPRTSTYASKELQNQLKNSPFASLFGNNPAAAQMLKSMTAGIPVMYLGDLTGVGVTGNQLASRVARNTIKELKPGVLEQNIVAQESERQRQTGQVRNSYSETILRFTKLNPTQLYVQAATIKYRNDGQFLQKVIMYGTVNRGQNTESASPFTGLPGLPGALPGGMGGMGGLNDLNKMLKDLQGL